MIGHPEETTMGIYGKSIKLINNAQAIAIAPGCHAKNRIIASSTAGKFHHVTFGKKEGEYKCDRSCPMWKGIKIFSHTIAAAEVNKELQQFIDVFEKAKGGFNITNCVETDMPRSAGKKGNAKAIKRLRAPKPLIVERVSRIQFNGNPFLSSP